MIPVKRARCMARTDCPRFAAGVILLIDIGWFAPVCARCHAAMGDETPLYVFA